MDKNSFKESAASFFKRFGSNVKNKAKAFVTGVRNFDIQKCRVNFTNTLEKMQSSGRIFAVTILCAFLVMLLACLAVFFISVRNPEKVMVPDVTGKELTTALLEMQVKELYPKIQLRYTNSPDDQGKIMNQSPEAGAIVKAGRRITLTVSRGVVIDHVDRYIGQKIDDVRIKLQTLFTGSTQPLITLADPVYKADQSEAGTILEQDPPEGTKLSTPVKVQLVVSRGPDYEKARVPNLVGMNVNDVLMVMSHTRIVFDFASKTAEGDEKIGTVVSQQSFPSEFVDNYTHMTVTFAFPGNNTDGTVYGIFSTKLTQYPYPVKMTLDAIPPDGEQYTLVTFNHTGGNITIPYALPQGTELVFSVVGKEVNRKEVQ